MDLIKSAIKDQLFNQRIGCCLQVILITWLLWRPIHCNSNRLNEGNRRTKSSQQRLNQNGFDPFHRPYPAYNRSESSLYSDQYNLNYNYLLSVLQNEERQAILNNVINEKSGQMAQGFDGKVHANVDTVVPQNDIELSAEERANIHDTNKLFSPSLNVIDVSPQDTQLAHSVLIIHKPKPNKSTLKPTIAPQLLFPQTITGIGSLAPLVTAMRTPVTTTTSTSTETYPTPVRNNHRPVFLRPFPGKIKTTTPPSTVSIKSSTTSTTILSSTPTNTVTDSQTINTTTTTSQESDDMPIVISSNHKYKHSFPMFTRQKLTSTEYALVFTTPESNTESDKSFTEVPTLSSITSSPIYTVRPPYMTTVSHQKRPPMKIMTVNANRIRQPEEIYSEGITVLDPPFSSGHPHKLPPNTTILHKNLIVPMKDGRPKPVYPMTSTTQFPIYPIVAGITKWHTSPTTPWPVPIVTTTSPEHMMTSTFTSDTTTLENPVTAQSVNRPVLITGHPMMSTQTQHTPQTQQTQQTQQTSHFVTVTPVKSTSHSPSSSTFVVTHSSPRPSTTTQGYVNAIWAPPMPIASRPVQAIQSQPSSGSWFSPISNIFSVDTGTSSWFNIMGVLRSFLVAFLVVFLPPFTLAAAMMQLAVG